MVYSRQKNGDKELINAARFSNISNSFFKHKYLFERCFTINSSIFAFLTSSFETHSEVETETSFTSFLSVRDFTFFQAKCMHACKKTKTESLDGVVQLK